MTYKTYITPLTKQHADWQAYDRHFCTSQESLVNYWATLRVDLMFQYANKQTTRSLETMEILLKVVNGSTAVIATETCASRSISIINA